MARWCILRATSYQNNELNEGKIKAKNEWKNVRWMTLYINWMKFKFDVFIWFATQRLDIGEP